MNCTIFVQAIKYFYVYLAIENVFAMTRFIEIIIYILQPVLNSARFF